MLGDNRHLHQFVKQKADVGRQQAVALAVAQHGERLALQPAPDRILR